MAELNKFIKTDQDNIEESKRILKQLHTDSLESIEKCAWYLQTITDTFGKKYLYDRYEEKFKKIVNKFNMSFSEAFYMLRQSEFLDFNNPILDRTPDEARQAITGIFSTLTRIYLMLRMRRDFFLGISEILRLRYTTAISYYRLQSESFALIHLFGEEPQIAEKWYDATTEHLGRKFYKDYHNKKIIPIIKNSDLHSDYQKASDFSMHSRIFGVISGLLIGGKMRENGKPREAIYAFREIDDSYTLFLWFINYLKFHEKLILNLKGNIKEFDSNDLQKMDISDLSVLIVEFSKILYKMKSQKK